MKSGHRRHHPPAILFMFLDTPTFIQGQNTLGKTILFLDHLSVMWEKKVINTVIEEVVVSCFG